MKDPAFLFYPNDYIGGTMGMTFEEKGAYIDLLMLQFNRGHMTSHMIGQVIGQLKPETQAEILAKFKIDVNGLYYNERLDIEIEKRRKFIQSRNNNLSGKNQYSKKGIKKDEKQGDHMTSHMENEDEDIISSSSSSSLQLSSSLINYNLIIENYHTLCSKMARVEKLTDKRKGFVNARFGEYGMEVITKVLRIAGESDFLNGKNDRAWKADFEWIMRPDNFIKVLEGKYSKAPKQKTLAA